MIFSYKKNVRNALGRHIKYMGKINNFMNVLLEANMVSNIDQAKQEITKYVRWCKTNMPNIDLIHVGNSTYLVDEEVFRKKFSALMDRRKQLRKQKSDNAKSLNDRIQKEKKASIRDQRGRLIQGAPQKSHNGFESLAALLEAAVPTEVEQAQKMLDALNSFRASKVKNHSSSAAKARLKALTEFIASKVNENPG